ncbi:MAG: hypothetical protein R3C28_02990 [Pirellulaceae bacterium]
MSDSVRFMRSEPSETSFNLETPVDWSRTKRAYGLRFLLLFSVLFFDGCDASNVMLSPGPFVRIVSIAYEPEAPDLTHLKPGTSFSFSLALTLANLAIAAIGIWILRTRPRLERHFLSRVFLVSLALHVSIFNSVLFGWSGWAHVVMHPTMQLYELVRQFVPLSLADSIWLLQGVARIYFYTTFWLTWLVCWLLCKLAARYLWLDQAKWWQFRLGGMLAVMVVLGTALGLFLRLL